MVAWLWFDLPHSVKEATQSGIGSSGAGSGSQAGVGSPEGRRPTKDQVTPTDRFLRFTNDLLATTQVSHSVVILSLLYLARLKIRNPISPSPGSEFRLTVTALMIANKVLDDNTYTARTWADVSNLELIPLVRGEAEFLRGLDFRLHVTGREFESWIRLLEGHVSRRNEQVSKARASRTKRQRLERPPTAGADMVGLGLGVPLVAPSERRVASEAKVAGHEGPVGVAAPALVRAKSNNIANLTINPPSAATFAYPTPLSGRLSPLPSQFAAGPSTAPFVSPSSHRLPSIASQPHSAPPKRRAGDAFDDDITTPPTFIMRDNSSSFRPTVAHLAPPMSARSYSQGASPAPFRNPYINPPPVRQRQPTPYLHPGHGYDPSPTEAAFSFRVDRRRSLVDGEVPTLAQANSPRYDWNVSARRDNLAYNALGHQRSQAPAQQSAPHPDVVAASGRRQSHSRSLSASQSRPRSSSGTAYAPAHPSHLNISSSPTDALPPGLAPPPLVRTYSGDAFVSYAGQHGPQQSLLPLPLQRAPAGAAQPWNFANAGPPGISWGTARELEAQGWNSYSIARRGETP